MGFCYHVQIVFQSGILIAFFPFFSKGYLCWMCLGSRPLSQERNQSLCRLQGIRKNFIDVEAPADSLPSSPSSVPGNSQQPRAVPAQLLSPWSLDFLPLLPVFCRQVLFLYKDSDLWLGSNLTHHDLVMNNGICTEPISK